MQLAVAGAVSDLLSAVELGFADFLRQAAVCYGAGARTGAAGPEHPALFARRSAFEECDAASLRAWAADFRVFAASGVPQHWRTGDAGSFGVTVAPGIGAAFVEGHGGELVETSLSLQEATDPASTARRRLQFFAALARLRPGLPAAHSTCSPLAADLMETPLAQLVSAPPPVRWARQLLQQQQNQPFAAASLREPSALPAEIAALLAGFGLCASELRGGAADDVHAPPETNPLVQRAPPRTWPWAERWDWETGERARVRDLWEAQIAASLRLHGSLVASGGLYVDADPQAQETTFLRWASEAPPPPADAQSMLVRAVRASGGLLPESLTRFAEEAGAGGREAGGVVLRAALRDARAMTERLHGLHPMKQFSGFKQVVLPGAGLCVFLWQREAGDARPWRRFSLLTSARFRKLRLNRGRLVHCSHARRKVPFARWFLRHMRPQAAAVHFHPHEAPRALPCDSLNLWTGLHLHPTAARESVHVMPALQRALGAALTRKTCTWLRAVALSKAPACCGVLDLSGAPSVVAPLLGALLRDMFGTHFRRCSPAEVAGDCASLLACVCVLACEGVLPASLSNRVLRTRRGRLVPGTAARPRALYVECSCALVMLPEAPPPLHIVLAALPSALESCAFWGHVLNTV